MFGNGTSLEYHVFEDYGVNFDEKGTTCGTVRKVQWVKEGNEPDESKAKIEIRKVTMKDNEETALKGYAFATEEGPGELITGMIKAGFGDTKEILRAVRTREDFMEAATTINEESDDSDSGEMFDMRKLLEGMNVEEEDGQYAV